VFEGEAVGAEQPVATGELVFNTALSGYQEVLTDPSYAGQVVAFTYPHIGNYGVNAIDDESSRARCQGVVVRDLVHEPSNWRAEDGLDGWLRRQGLPGISGVDTRRLTRHLRDAGAMPCAFGTATEHELRDAAARAEPTDGRDLVSAVTTTSPYVRGEGPRRVVAYDFGVKENQLRHLARLATVTVVPAHTPASDVLALEPHGLFLSNGPGDPSALRGPIGAIADLVGKVPIFGICLGHQLLCSALGGSTYKLSFGHHGTNHPVQRLADGAVEITSQNHNYAVRDVPGVEVTHVNLNDGVVEGVRMSAAPAFSVQYHPEAGPGPHDAGYLFDTFAELLG
jgi:carbamoyl-phosphate synthase small subunit